MVLGGPSLFYDVFGWFYGESRCVLSDSGQLWDGSVVLQWFLVVLVLWGSSSVENFLPVAQQSDS